MAQTTASGRSEKNSVPEDHPSQTSITLLGRAPPAPGRSWCFVIPLPVGQELVMWRDWVSRRFGPRLARRPRVHRPRRSSAPSECKLADSKHNQKPDEKKGIRRLRFLRDASNDSWKTCRLLWQGRRVERWVTDSRKSRFRGGWRASDRTRS